MTNNDELALKEDWRNDFEKIFPVPAGMERNPPRKDGGIAGYVNKTCLSGLAVSYLNCWNGYKAARKSLLAERDADKKRIAELEARTVSVKLPPVSFFDFKAGAGFASGAYVNFEAMNNALAAAGIKLEVGE